MATLRKLPTMVAVAAFTAALSGCGGNDGKLVRDLEADVEAAVARATAAEAAKALAEMAQAEAETAATMASSARMTAEQERDTATAAQMMAEEARTAAEMRQSEAEMAQAMAEEAQAEAEMAQAEAEMARETARTAQAAAEAAQAAAQAAAMEARADEEDARAAERAARMAETAALTRAAAAEAKSTADEAAKMAAETAQAEAEMAQMAAETARMAAEADKKAAETAQAAAETARKAAEADKKAAEADKKAAEADKKAAETAQAQAEEDLRKAEERIDELLAELDRDRDAETAKQVAAAISSNRVGWAHLVRWKGATRVTNEVVVDSRRNSGGYFVPSDYSDPALSSRSPDERVAKKTVYSQLPFLSQDQRKAGSSTQLNPTGDRSDHKLNGHLTTVSASRTVDNMLTVNVSLPTTVGGTKYTPGMSTASADDVWNSATVERRRGGVGDETIMVYTDINAPTPTSFVYDSPAVGSVNDYAARSMMTLIKKDAKTEDDKVMVEPVAMAAPIVLDSPPSPGTTQRYARSVATPIARIGGSFGGVRGTYVCDSACQFKTSPGGVVTLDDTFTKDGGYGVYFRPDDPSMRFLAPDRAYTYFGWWMFDPSPGGVYMIEGFSGRVHPTLDNANPRASEVRLEAKIAGTATYMGRAVGRYATKDIPARNNVIDGEVGSFTADAMLSADFGTSSDETNFGVVSGTVSKFDMSGATDASDWVLTLGRAGLGGSAPPAGLQQPRDQPRQQPPFDDLNNPNNFAGVTTLNATSDVFTATSGRWEGRFFDGATATTTGTPATVIGTFDSHDNVAHITGAFGAKKQ